MIIGKWNLGESNAKIAGRDRHSEIVRSRNLYFTSVEVVARAIQ